MLRPPFCALTLANTLVTVRWPVFVAGILWVILCKAQSDENGNDN